MKISVITACYNSESTIDDCLRSVASQTHPEVEHCIVDGGSTDATLSKIRNFANPDAVLLCEPDDGVYFALNKGLSQATGDVIGFLHSDDVFENPQVLERVAKELGGSDADACYADLVYVKKDELNEVVRYWESDDYRPGMFRRGWMPPHPTFYAKRKIYDQFGGFDTKLKIGADWDLLARLFELHGIESVYVSEIWVRMRLGGMSNRNLTNIIRNNLETGMKCREHFGIGASLFFTPRKWLHRLGQFRQPDG